MKAEHRHELKTNELADWLVHFPQWIKENLRMIIYFAIVIVLVVAAYIWKYYQKNIIATNEQLRFTALMVEVATNKQQSIAGQEQGIDYSYTLIQTSNKLQEFANTAKNKNMAAFALVKSAEALRTELHYHMGAMEQKYHNDQLAKTKALYEQAIEKAQSNSIKAQALLGLGLCEEELGNFDKAKEIYTQIKDDKTLEGTVASAAAAQRFSTIDNYKEKLAFLSSPTPPASPSSFEQSLSEINPELLPDLKAVISPNLPSSE